MISTGPLQESCDSLAYKVLINTDTLQSYISLLMETQWLVVMGTKGTCKTNLARGLSRHLMQIVGDGEEGEEGEGGGDVVVINYNVEKDGVEVCVCGACVCVCALCACVCALCACVTDYSQFFFISTESSY